MPMFFCALVFYQMHELIIPIFLHNYNMTTNIKRSSLDIRATITIETGSPRNPENQKSRCVYVHFLFIS